MIAARNALLKELSIRSGWTSAEELLGVLSTKYIPVHGYRLDAMSVAQLIGAAGRSEMLITKGKARQGAPLVAMITEKGLESLDLKIRGASSFLEPRSGVSPLTTAWRPTPKRTGPANEIVRRMMAA